MHSSYTAQMHFFYLQKYIHSDLLASVYIFLANNYKQNMKETSAIKK